jgi:hypothetical protein
VGSSHGVKSDAGYGELIMKSRTRDIFLLVLSVVASIAWLMIDYFERGFHISIFGGPVIVLGMIGLPSFIDLMKKKKDDTKSKK